MFLNSVDISLTGTSGTRPPALWCPSGWSMSTLGFMWCHCCMYICCPKKMCSEGVATNTFSHNLWSRFSRQQKFEHCVKEFFFLQVGSRWCDYGNRLHVRTASKAHVVPFLHVDAGETTKVWYKGLVSHKWFGKETIFFLESLTRIRIKNIECLLLTRPPSETPPSISYTTRSPLHWRSIWT